MDIAEFLNSLNAKIASLESADVEQKKRLAEMEAQLERQNEDSTAQIHSLKQNLQAEEESHAFTRLQLDDAQENVVMSIRLLRDLQQLPGDASVLYLALQEKQSTIARLQSELTQERQARAQAEAKMSETMRGVEKELAKRRLLKSMVNVLTQTLQQRKDQENSYIEIISEQKNEIERKFASLVEKNPLPLNSPSTVLHHESTLRSTSASKDLYLEELDIRFSTILDLIEEAEGKPLLPDSASSIKSSIRDAKQVIGEEIIIAHANSDLETLIGSSTRQLLEQEKSTNAHLMSIVNELQTQLDSYVHIGGDPSTFSLSFISAGPMSGE